MPTNIEYRTAFAIPNILEPDGTDVSARSVGFNAEAFYATGRASYAQSSDEPKRPEILYLSFEMVSPGKEGEMQYYEEDLFEIVDLSLLYKGKE